jgi:5-methylcytosine-specific restriction endonuclease McrA
MNREALCFEFTTVSDEQLLEGLSSLVRRGRHLTAQIVAHLAEVEHRRLHLKGGYSSLFVYCRSVHGMSEDEACRRIEVARLACRFPRIFELLASGALSLSVAALLKEHLTPHNQDELLAAVSHKSVYNAREVLAAHCPQPDAPSKIRKLPDTTHRPTTAPSAADSADALLAPRLFVSSPDESERSVHATRDIAGKSGASEGAGENGASASTRAVAGENGASAGTCDVAGEPEQPVRSNGATSDEAGRRTPRTDEPWRDRSRMDPSSLGRYRVQFTATAELKAKLELARDLAAHRNPGLDLAPVIESAIDLLIEKLLKQRTGKTSRSKARPSTPPRTAADEATTEPRQASKPAQDSRQAPEASTRTSHPTPARIDRATRRMVVERDGLRCSYVDETGHRCEARAFLEYDHRTPAAMGGGSRATNIRILCRAHNQYAAELAYGREKVAAETERKRRRRPESG